MAQGVIKSAKHPPPNARHNKKETQEDEAIGGCLTERAGTQKLAVAVRAGSPKSKVKSQKSKNDE